MNKLALSLIFLAFSASAVHAEGDSSCETLLASGDYAKAVEAGKLTQGFKSRMCVGKALSSQDKHNEAYEQFVEAEKVGTEGFEQVMSVIFQARAKRDAGDAPQAYALYQRGFDLAVKSRNRQGQLANLNEPGQMLLDAHDPKTALTRFQQAYPLAANDNERAETNELIAAAYRQMSDYDHAIEHQLRATNQEQSNGDFNHYLYATLELAAIRTEAKEFNAAQKNIDEALRQSKAVGSTYWEAKTLLYQGRLEKAKGNGKQAHEIFNQASTLAAKVGESTLSSDIAEELK